jgi:hypothetical protein
MSFCSQHLDCSQTTIKIMGAACIDELGSAVARSGQAGTGPRSSCPCYGWFTEGFDTLDLKQAEALLDELAQRGDIAEESFD